MELCLFREAGEQALADSLKSLHKTVNNLPAVEVETALRAAALVAMAGEVALSETIIEEARAQPPPSQTKVELLSRAWLTRALILRRSTASVTLAHESGSDNNGRQE